MGGEQIVGRLDHGVHHFDLDGRVIESFRWAYMHCVILPGVCGANGYVRLPKQTLRKLRRVRDIGSALEFNRRLTYINRRTGWIGFDTTAPGDYWILADARAYSIDPKEARVLSVTRYRESLKGYPTTDWTLDMVRLRTRYLAELADLYQQRHAAPWVRWLFGAPARPARPGRGA